MKLIQTTKALAVALSLVVGLASYAQTEMPWVFGAANITLSSEQIQVLDSFAADVEAGNFTRATEAITALNAHLADNTEVPVVLSGDLAAFNSSEHARFLLTSLSQLISSAGSEDETITTLLSSVEANRGWFRPVPEFVSNAELIEPISSLADEIRTLQKRLSDTDADVEVAEGESVEGQVAPSTPTELTPAERASITAQINEKSAQLGSAIRGAVNTIFSRSGAGYETVSASSEYVRELKHLWKGIELTEPMYSVLGAVSTALSAGKVGSEVLLTQAVGAVSDLLSGPAISSADALVLAKVDAFLALYSQLTTLIVLDPIAGVKATKVNGDVMIYDALYLGMALLSQASEKAKALGKDMVDQVVHLNSRLKTRLGYLQKYPGSYGDSGVSSATIAQAMLGPIVISNNLYNAAEKDASYAVRSNPMGFDINNSGKEAFKGALIDALRVSLIDEGSNLSSYVNAMVSGPLFRRHYDSKRHAESAVDELCRSAVRIKAILTGGSSDSIRESVVAENAACKDVNAAAVLSELAQDGQGYAQFFKGDIPNALIDTHAFGSNGLIFLNSVYADTLFSSVHSAYFSEINYIQGSLEAGEQLPSCLDESVFAAPSSGTDLMVRPCQIKVSGMDLYDESKLASLNTLIKAPVSLALRFAAKHAPGQLSGVVTDTVEGLDSVLDRASAQVDAFQSLDGRNRELESASAKFMAGIYGDLIATTLTTLGEVYADESQNTLLWPLYSAPVGMGADLVQTDVLKNRFSKLVQTVSLVLISIDKALRDYQLPIGLESAVSEKLAGVFAAGSTFRSALIKPRDFFETESFVANYGSTGTADQAAAATSSVGFEDMVIDEFETGDAITSARTEAVSNTVDLFTQRAGSKFSIEAFRMMFEVPTGAVDEVVIDAESNEKAYVSRYTNQELAERIIEDASRVRSTYINGPAL